MESQKAEIYYSPVAHTGAVDVQGLEDLFQWASETVADGLDGRQRRAREQQIKKQVLSIIHRSAEAQAQAKYVNELAYMQRRVIALQGALVESNQESINLKQVVVAQYFALQRIPELEEKIIQLEGQSLFREKAELERKQAEAERKEVEEDRNHLMKALAKLKTERDYLDELVTVNESENTRLAVLLADARKELEDLKNRRWWHFFFPANK